MKQPSTVVASLVMALSGETSAGLARVQFLPPGRTSGVASSGPFEVDLRREDALAAISVFRRDKAAGGNPMLGLFDYEHNSIFTGDTRAAGWIEDFQWDETLGLVSLVKWTSGGKRAIEAEEYRYVSPVFASDKQSKRIIRLDGAALTNNPAIVTLQAVAAKRGEQVALGAEGTEGNNGKEHEMEWLKKLAGMLGLGEDATEEQVWAELTKKLSGETAAQSALKGLGLLVGEAGGDAAKLTGVDEQLALVKSALKKDAGNAGTIAEVVALKSEVKRLSEESQKSREAAVDAELNALVKAGRLTPAEVSTYRTIALTNRSTFDDLLKSRPAGSGVPLTGTQTAATGGTAGGSVGGKAKEFAAKVGEQEQQILKAGGDRNTARQQAWNICKGLHRELYEAARQESGAK